MTTSSTDQFSVERIEATKGCVAVSARVTHTECLVVVVAVVVAVVCRLVIWPGEWTRR